MRSSERTECIKSLIKLKQQQEVIEKTLDHFLDSTKLEPKILRDVRNEERSFTSDRKKITSSLRVAVEDITNDLKAIKSVMGALKEGRKIDIDIFKGKLVALTKKIREYKKISLLETLISEEIELDRDLHAFSLALHKYEIRNCTASSLIASRESSMSKNSISMDCHDYSVLRDFDALVAKTGHTQSWSEEDHLFFLKIRKTTRSVPAMVAAIRKKFPDLSSDRIVNHEAWYKIYLDLRDRHRKTIREWRKKKDMEKRSKLDRAEDETRCPNSKEKISNLETVTNEADPVASKSIAITKDPSRCDKKELLNRWRVDKENARSFEAAKIKLAIESEEALKESRRLVRAKELKATVEAYRQKKIESRSSSSTTSVTDSDRVTSKAEVAKLIKCFRRQDEELLSRRRALLQSKKSHSSAPVRQRVDSQSNKRSTLLKPTKVWLEKCKAEESRVRLPQQILYVKHIPKLATCDWRNREST